MSALQEYAELAGQYAALKESFRSLDRSMFAVVKQRTELLSIVAQIGDALSPTGERPEEALGALVRDVQDLVERIPCGYCDGVGVAPEERFGRDPDGAPMVDGPQPCPEGCEIAAWLVAERNDAADTEKERDRLRADLYAERETAAQLRADYAEAADELQGLRHSGWIVARDGGRDCDACDQEIQRGQAYELVPNNPDPDALRHIHCPTSKEQTMPATADDGPITPDDEIEIKATTVATRTFTVDRAEYEQCLADGEVDDLFDVYVSDMNEETTYTTPDGKIHAYPSGEVIGDESDGAF